MTEALKKIALDGAARHASDVRRTLLAANTVASPVEHLLLLPMIAAATAQIESISALRTAIDGSPDDAKVWVVEEENYQEGSTAFFVARSRQGAVDKARDIIKEYTSANSRMDEDDEKEVLAELEQQHVLACSDTMQVAVDDLFQIDIYQLEVAP